MQDLEDSQLSQMSNITCFLLIVCPTFQASLSNQVLRDCLLTAAGITSNSQWWNDKAPCIQKTWVMQDSTMFIFDEWAKPFVHAAHGGGTFFC